MVEHLENTNIVKTSPLDILWSDDDYVAVAKPAGLATIPGRAETDTVLERLGRQLGLPVTGTQDPRLRVVHRLDKETSGVLLFAKHSAAQRHASHQFQNNTIAKEYVAIVRGRPQADEGDIDQPLALHPHSRIHMIVTPHGRSARTAWKVEQRFRDLALLRVFPKTGKTHQIRVHLKHIGLPLAIDPLYNPPRKGASPGIFLSQFKRSYRLGKGEQERPLIDRLTLHAHRLRFQKWDGQPIELEAPLPKDLRATLNMLQKYAMR